MTPLPPSALPPADVLPTDTAVPLWRVETLGRFRATLLANTRHTVEKFQTQKTALLFALLSHHYPRPLRREALLLSLWPDADAATGRDRLSQALSWLRRHFEVEAGLAPGAVIRASRDDAGLTPGSITTDDDEFRAGLIPAPTLAPADTLARLEAALALYHGPYLVGLGEEEDALFARQQELSRLYTDALARVSDQCERAGRVTTAVTYARRLHGLQPDDASACERLVHLLARHGETDEARLTLTAFRRAGRDGNSGKALPPALQKLAQMLQAPPRPKPADPAAPPSPGRLPLNLTRYFGRDREIAAVLREVGDEGTRLLTILGPGGAGKTRLATEIAHRFETEEGRRAWFVPLETVTRARQIIPALHRVLQPGETREDGPALRAEVADLLQTAPRPLVVLDNAEHLAGDRETLTVATDLLLRVPTLALLVTSRRPMGIDGEQTLTLAPLLTPPRDTSPDAGDTLRHYPSVEMFVDRACQVRRDFALTRENRAAVAALCTALEGLPLAIELCAAWANTLTPQEMLTQLLSTLPAGGNPQGLLVSRRADAPARHRSMRAAVDTSYLLLPPDLRRLFARLSVFRGGWFAPATAIASDTGDQALTNLARLQEHSLVVAETVRDPTGEGNATRIRFRLLDTLREFAAEQLDPAEQEALSRRHADYYVALAEQSLPFMNGRQQRQWLDILEAEHDNFRAALSFYEGANETQCGLRLALALRFYWRRRGYISEACEFLGLFLHRLLVEGPPDPVQEATVRNVLGRALTGQGELDAALAQQTAALAVWEVQESKEGRAATLLEIGINHHYQGNKEMAVAFIQRSAALAEEVFDRITLAACHLNLGDIALLCHDLPGAQDHLEKCLTCAREINNDWLVTNALNNLGEVSRLRGEYAVAVPYYEEAVRGARAQGSPSNVVLPLLNLAEIARLTGDLPRAHSLLDEALTLTARGCEAFLIVQCLFAASVLAQAEGDSERAAVLLGAVQARQRAISPHLPIADPDDQARLSQTLTQQLGPLRFLSLLSDGDAQPTTAIIALAQIKPEKV